MLRTGDSPGKMPPLLGDDLPPPEKHNGIPILRGEIVGEQLKIACPFCRYRGRPVYHWHGWDLAAGPDALTHRVAHCHSATSPFDRTGYFIGVASAVTGGEDE